MIPQSDPTGAFSPGELSSNTDYGNFAIGIKDGIVFVTGDESKMFFCNGNLSQSVNVFYGNYYQYFVDQVTIDDKFSSVNMQTTLGEFAEHISTSLRWPYFVSYSCYWSHYELYSSFDEQDLPYLFPFLEEEGQERPLTTGEQIVMNILFNMGF